MSYVYYRLLATEDAELIPLAQGYEIKVFSPRLNKLSLHAGFSPLYIFWFLLTRGKYKIYYVFDSEERIEHYSNVMPKIFKYAFMPRKNSIHIGPCWTSKSSRGKGLYPAVLSRICQDYKNYNIYIFTDQGNIPSVKGIEKVHFRKFATGFKSKGLGVYIIDKRLE